MKTSAIRKLRQKLSANQPVYGLWITLESASIAEMAVALGVDWIVVDAEHGHLDWQDILAHIRATVRSDTVALVRVAELNVGLIKRALDIGADGVVVPWVESADQLRQAVAFAHYPPEGVRGVGAERATCWGQCFSEHVGEANENVLVIPIIETVKGGRNIDALLEVPGTEIFFFGPADYSSSAGYPGQWEGPGVAQQILALQARIRSKGKHGGIIATSNENLRQRREEGFRMLGLGLDGGLLLRSLRGALATVGSDRKITPSFTLESAPLPVSPLDRPPESMRPDRMESMNPVGSGKTVELERGVVFECLVGAHNQARQLTTGLVTLAAGASLPYHTHTFTESVTVLQGEVSLEVEGRAYTLEPYDNMVVPPGKVHTARNVSGRHPAVLHLAMATDQPTRTLVKKYFPRKPMGASSTGQPGEERVNRFRSAKRFAAGPNTEFIDFFNRELVPGIEMSGGYALFHPGGRLPAHVHDFDESICITQGEATCVVEGRRYSMSDSMTALQPRGRVHYFINESQAPMVMLWVYAGPVPERIVVDERCATIEGNPWK